MAGRNDRRRRSAAALALLPALVLSGAGCAGRIATPTYRGDVRPILEARCFRCHGEEEDLQAGLDLRLYRTIVEGGQSGPALVPGKPEESLLWEMVSQDEMPPEGEKLTEQEVALIRRWIAEGARER